MLQVLLILVAVANVLAGMANVICSSLVSMGYKLSKLVCLAANASIAVASNVSNDC